MKNKKSEESTEVGTYPIVTITFIIVYSVFFCRAFSYILISRDAPSLK